MQYICLVSALFVLVLSRGIPTIPQPRIDVWSGPNCHMCEVILNNVRYEYRNNFTNVTPDQLRQSLYQQCDLNLNGFTDQECHKIADEDSADILQQLQEGTSSYRICQRELLC
ncbi:Saposin B-type domain-containing protein [Caenorhabditis elegans]|uniref:Saposin B-type domain-containing protein n=1 Tax=Caenorhabditis elegans TaxID=6239 RepID=Q3Y3Z7_CAEEL|nr:Saposin B-type domain-containing protein [Caenorhabditis elegans]CAJ28586.1 Saposin B-type domain-containing protein [Caenorhabditis elegans]|eukprot:NP_001032977.1 Uncharacterized protein CELE_K02A11.4 [Caenorhabditis elegans]